LKDFYDKSFTAIIIIVNIIMGLALFLSSQLVLLILSGEPHPVIATGVNIFCVYLDGGQRFLCRGFFLALDRLRVVFHGVGVDVVWFSCFSALIAATSRGSGLQQQLLFCAANLS